MSTDKLKKQRYQVGGIVKISLEAGLHTYARILEMPLVTFYNSKSNADLSINDIISWPILFKIWVMKHVITSGRWPKVGYLPLEKPLREIPTLSKQDPLNPSKIYMYRGGKEYPATREQCEQLERAAVWEPEHVEERLKDHYAGRPNRWVESLKIPD